MDQIIIIHFFVVCVKGLTEKVFKDSVILNYHSEVKTLLGEIIFKYLRWEAHAEKNQNN